jgi:L-lysine 6-transaminase
MIDPHQVHETLERHQLVDGYPIVLDLDRSHGSWIHDARTGREFLDAFTCFASWPVGYNHPAMDDPAFLDELTRCAKHKPANSDLYTSEMASFVDAFGTHATPPEYPYHFWIAGGGLAVENALKAAFDWKARKLGRTTFDASVDDLVILHFEQAFHGRTGYTMSLTNTLPDKIGLFPKFNWPRVYNPAIVFDSQGKIANDIEAEERRAIAEIEAVFTGPEWSGRHVAGILIEPMQGEGGDNHFRPEFLAALRRFADEREALLLYDEVQTGFFGTGKPWLWQHTGVAPDVVAFGKKTQVCGVYAGHRLDEVENHVFRMSSRINSTWGGNLTDMVRSRKFIEIIKGDGLEASITRAGEEILAGLRATAADSGAFTNVRGLGSLIAFDFEDKAGRERMLHALYDQRVLALPCGKRSVRFRLPLTISTDEVKELLNRVNASLPAVASS